MKAKQFFGTDGVRGLFGEEPITPSTVLKIGWALGRVLQERNSKPGRVLIGKDTRVSGYLMESALEAGLTSAGIDISLLGPMPTPGIAYLTRTARAQAGIVISASHNPYHDNGIKFFSPDGSKLLDEVELQIEHYLQQTMTSVSSKDLGKAERYPDAAGRYIEFCKSTIPHRVFLEGLRIVVDCANGAAYHIAPDVFHELGADVIAISNSPDGFNINRRCGSTHPGKLQQEVVKREADIGVALDGDGDRVLLVDSTGELVDGDQILYILGMARHGAAKNAGGIVGTLMSNLGLEKACQSRKIKFKRTAVGDRYVMECLKRQRWSLGGETSGHIICLDKSSTGDGIIAALQVIHEIIAQGKSLAELKAGMKKYPQRMINVALAGNGSGARVDLEHNACIKDAIADAEAELSDEGRIVLRASGTEPVIRVMVEGDDLQQVNQISESLAAVVRNAGLT